MDALVSPFRFLSCIFIINLSVAVHGAPQTSDYGTLPSTHMVSVSPDGDKVAFRKTDGEKDMVVVYSLKEQKYLAGADTTAITPRNVYFVSDTKLIMVVSEFRRIHGYRGSHNLSAAYVMDINTGEVQQLLTAGDNIYLGQSSLGGIVGMSPDNKYVYMPAFVGNSREASPDFGLMRVELDSPKRPREHIRGAQNITDYFVDEKGEVVAREYYNNASNEHAIWARKNGDWKKIHSSEEEIISISIQGLTPDRKSLVVLGEDEKTGRVSYYTMSLADGSLKGSGFGRADADIEHLLMDINRVVYGVVYSGFMPSYLFFDQKVDKRMKEITALFSDHSVWLRDWSADWKNLIVYVEGSSSSGEYYLFTEGQPGKFLVAARPDIKPEEVHPIATYSYNAADGMTIPALLTIPRDKVSSLKNLPAVMMPHGGPESYDQIGFDGWAQALANRGYLVIQPQFRGSAGFGSDHAAAGRGEWGKKMQSDLTDGINALVGKGIVDPDRICIVGGSYGGYAALAGGAFTPELYKCVASLNGVSDIARMLKDEKREHGKNHWVVSYWERSMGNGEADKNTLEAVSPINYVGKFKAPVLLIHGENDKVVPFRQSKAMAKKLKKAGRQVEFIELKDEHHSLVTAAARIKTVESIVAFVDRHIGQQK